MWQSTSPQRLNVNPDWAAILGQISLFVNLQNPRYLAGRAA
jgi:hypothetical protein